MNWRRLVLSGILAAGLGLTSVPRTFADPPPWAGVWRHDRYGDDDGDDDAGYGRSHEGRWRGRYGRDDARCGEILDRIDNDRGKIAEIAPTGRHRKALQWYRDDLQNAHRDLNRCRDGSGDDSAWFDDRYDRTDSGDDDSYDDANDSFDWKNDWPLLLGSILAPQH